VAVFWNGATSQPKPKGDFHMARNTTTTTSSEPKAPDFVAWHVTSKGDKSYWHKVGASWMHKDKKGLTLQMEAIPLGGRIVLRKPTDNTNQGARA
jgi:hypothetical protein